MLTRLRIKNFKRFGDADVELGQSVVFIGPNNSGKTTALQALALWDVGLRKWNERREGKTSPEKRPGVTMNRRDLIAIPVPDANLLWRNLHVRDVRRTNGKQETQHVNVDVIVDGVTEGKAWSCGFEFDYANEESFYCRPLRLSEDKAPQRMPVPPEAADSRFAMSQSIADFRIRSVMCGPLFNAEGKAFGVIQLDTQDRTKKFTQDDLRLLMGVAYQAATALENVQMHQSLLARERFQRDMELAKQVQRGFLPRSLPQIAGYQFFAHYESALDVGGDYYDFIPLGGGRLAVLLGDVAGKGVPAALLMAKLSAEARFCMLTEKDPAAAVGRINQLLLDAGFGDRFVTLAAAFLDPAKHQVTLVNAGHLPPLLYRPSAGTVEDAMPGDLSGLPLGVLEGNQYAAHKLDLKPGDSLLLYTDGITDALNVDNVAFGMKGLRAAILATKPTGPEPLQPADVGAQVVQTVKRHAEGRSQYDDIAMVCFGRVK